MVAEEKIDQLIESHVQFDVSGIYYMRVYLTVDCKYNCKCNARIVLVTLKYVTAIRSSYLAIA